MTCVINPVLVCILYASLKFNKKKNPNPLHSTLSFDSKTKKKTQTLYLQYIPYYCILGYIKQVLPITT